MKKQLLLLLIFCSLLNEEMKAWGKILEDRQRFNTICVDPQNNVWMGSSTGLFQWNNQSVQRIILPTTMSISAIESINNHLILGCTDGRIFSYQLNNKYLSLIADLHVGISTIQLRDQTLYIGSQGKGIVTISPFEYHHLTTRNGLNDDFIYQLHLFNNEIWTSSDKGLQITNPKLITRTYSLNDRIPDRLVTCFSIKSPYIYCGTQSGDICRIDSRNDSIVVYDNTIWNSGQVNDIRVLDRSMAIATNNGAYLLDTNGHLLESFTKNQPVNQINVDQEANLFFCGDHLFLSSLGEQFSVSRIINDINVSNTHAILTDNNSNLFFTPDQGLVKYNSIRNSFLQTSFTKNFQSIDITSLCIDTYGKLWVGTSGRGLFLVDTSTLSYQAIQIDSSVESSEILSITCDSNTIWVSSLNGVWYSSLNQPQYAFKSLEDEFQQKKYYVYQVRKDIEGNLWLATDGQGILKFSNGIISNFTKEHQITSTVFYGIEEDAENQLWFNTYNEGLYCLKKDSMIQLNQSNGLSSNEILCITHYKKDFLIAGSSNGIDIINIHDLSVSHLDLESMHLSQIPETNSIATDKNDNVYIGTNIGILKLYLPSYKTHFLPQAFIEDISVMEKCCAKTVHVFTADENYFRFLIRANYNSSQAIFFRYKLKGLNDQWNHTIDKQAVFPRLNPGSYEFVLECANNRTFFNATQDRYSFTIENPFYKKSWFVLLLLIGFAIAFYYYVRFREKRISRVEQLEKEKVIAEFETLKHQVSPHFLFNSFNTLIQVIDEDKEQAIEYTQMLSDYYRSLLSYRNVDLVTFTEELILLDKYIYLQKMRFGDALLFQNRCKNEPTSEIQIPPLTLQLLAENAIKHNTVSSSKPLNIIIQINNDRIEVINNLNEKISNEVGENIGLQNIKNRFKLFTKTNVEIARTDSHFIVSLPILKP